jgi:hypothetical protein
MSARPLVSVVIATYNHEAFIGPCLDSVLAQEPCGGEVEVIVVDDGSTDGTGAVLERYAREHGVRVIARENGGNIAAYNSGIAAAQGKYMALLDGDDTWHPDKTRRQVAMLEADPSLALVYSDMEHVDAEGNLLAPSHHAKVGIETRDGSVGPFGYLMSYNFVLTCTIMVRMSLRERFDPIPAWGRAQDWWIALSVSRDHRIAHCGGSTGAYRHHGSNLYMGRSARREAELRARELEVRRWTFAQAPEVGVAVDDLVRAYREFRRCVQIASAGLGRTEAELIPDRVEHVDAANERLADAVYAERRGDFERGARLAASVLADLPRDAAAVAVLDRCVRGLHGAPPMAEARPAESRWPLDDARAFVTVAFADELAAHPDLLSSYAEAIGPDDDATLAVHALGRDEGEVVGALLEALAAAGVDPETGPDLLVLNQPAAEATEATIAREAHAVLGHGPVPPRYEARPRVADAAALRALAEARWDVAPRSFAIKIAPPAWDGAEGWGDTHFARAVAAELRRRGHAPRVEVVHEWESSADADVVLVLRGLSQFVPRPGQRSLLWVISHPELVSGAECDRYDHVFVASAPDAERIAALTRTPVSVLEQATDPAVFFPEHDAALAHEIAYVGNSRGVRRRALDLLLPTARDLAVWGRDWEGLIDARHVVGTHLPSDAVRRAYSSAGVVLNDHWDAMRDQGYVSNRVYDVLACGGALLTDDVPGLRERFGSALATYGSREELAAEVERLLATARDGRGRERVLAGHTFAHRVDALLAAAGAVAPAGSAASLAA